MEGNSIEVAEQLDGTNDVVSIVSNMSSYAALHSDGSVTTWGYPTSGGDQSEVSGKLDGTVEVLKIYSTGSAFAALRSDGSVVSWGGIYDGVTAVRLQKT